MGPYTQIPGAVEAILNWGHALYRIFERLFLPNIGFEIFEFGQGTKKLEFALPCGTPKGGPGGGGGVIKNVPIINWTPKIESFRMR